MTIQKHTPVPWSVWRGNGGGLYVGVEGKSYVRIGLDVALKRFGQTFGRGSKWHLPTNPLNWTWIAEDERGDDAAFIVRAVNSHDHLIRALTMMVDEKCDYMRINHLGDPETQHTVKAARAALAKAETP